MLNCDKTLFRTYFQGGLVIRKVFRIFILCFVLGGSVEASQFLKCVTEDYQRTFIISPMLKRNLLLPGNHKAKKSSFALIRMKHQGKILSQELNHYKVSERRNSLKIKAKSRFQSNFIARAIWNNVMKRIPDFKINLNLNPESTDGSGKISLMEYNDKAKYARSKYEVYCKAY